MENPGGYDRPVVIENDRIKMPIKNNPDHMRVVKNFKELNYNGILVPRDITKKEINVPDFYAIPSSNALKENSTAIQVDCFK